MDWDGLRVTLYTHTDEGGKLFLQAPNGRHPAFTLHYVAGSNPRKYTVSFDPGYMQPCWNKCNPLTEEGDALPDLPQGLIHLVENDPTINNVYAKALAPLLGQMQAVDSSLKMLRGTMQVTVRGQQATDLVRMIYLTGVVPVDGGGPKDDLVVVALAPQSSGGPQEDGGGSGPPH